MNKKLIALLALVFAASARHLQYHYVEVPSHEYSEEEIPSHYEENNET